MIKTKDTEDNNKKIAVIIAVKMKPK
jgi:hypothetical protein